MRWALSPSGMEPLRQPASIYSAAWSTTSASSPPRISPSLARTPAPSVCAVRRLPCGILAIRSRPCAEDGRRSPWLRRLAHPYTLAYVQHWVALLYTCRREVHEVQKLSDAVTALAREQGFPYWSTQGTILQGWVRIEQGRVQEGMAQMRQGVVGLQATPEAVCSRTLSASSPPRVEEWDRREKVWPCWMRR